MDLSLKKVLFFLRFQWLNNCIGKRNYTTFILLMVSVVFMVSYIVGKFSIFGSFSSVKFTIRLIFFLLQLIIEGGTAVAVFIRCFADKRGMEHELVQKLHSKFPRGLLATIAVSTS